MWQELLKRNSVLAWLGVAHFVLAAMLAIYANFNDVVVLGINSMIKPIKFALSIGIYAWTMGWILHYHQRPQAVAKFSRAAVYIMSFEQLVITGQAFRGELSHFNTSSIVGMMLFSMMGIAITVLTIWALRLAWQLITQRDYTIAPAYMWGIRLGIVLMVLFSFEGQYMGYLMRHSVGGADGGEGLPLINWNRHYGDLRVAHFMGIHAIQVLPMAGYALSRLLSQKAAVWATWGVAVAYFAFATWCFVQAVLGYSLM